VSAHPRLPRCPRSGHPAASPALAAPPRSAGWWGNGGWPLSPVVERPQCRGWPGVSCMAYPALLGPGPGGDRPADAARIFCWGWRTRTLGDQLASPLGACCGKGARSSLTTMSLEQLSLPSARADCRWWLGQMISCRLCRQRRPVLKLCRNNPRFVLAVRPIDPCNHGTGRDGLVPAVARPGGSQRPRPQGPGSACAGRLVVRSIHGIPWLSGRWLASAPLRIPPCWHRRRRNSPRPATPGRSPRAALPITPQSGADFPRN